MEQRAPERAPIRAPIVVGIAGGTGAGKTTVAQAIRALLGDERVTLLSEDAYYRDYSQLAQAERDAINWDHPDAVESELLLDHIERLRRGEPIERPVYDFVTHTRAPDRSVRVEPRPVIVVEGILLFVEERLRNAFDIKLFVETDADLRFIRRLRRDITERGRSVESVIQQYLATVRPMGLAFVEPSKRYADLILPDGGANAVALDLLRAALLHASA